ncbi:translocation/assembly module TamB domain-containing protein [Rubrivirga sp. S365]|uniref:translocation/assembly module TamB domain-containing protein n=1 Tax=Rubrivirga sp. S365 TaxID=3076080 RepID=UPI0028C5BB89|nr:translocation/assembly module TamB domain-containing protein [Rubrivirga sp. S365]MDT7856527.1 translocation/assembly module TamB domain-containing protein [Rubrivirga sp. S365]
MPTQPTRSDSSLGDGAASKAARPAPPDREGGAGRWSLGRRLGVAALVVLAVVVVAVVGVVVYLQTESGRARVQTVAVEQIQNLLADDATVSVERLDGTFLTGARLVGLDIERGGETVVAVDTLTIDYNLASLLRRTFSASDVYVAGPSVYVRQRADSTFNVSDLLKPAADTSSSGGFAVELGRVRVRRGRAEVHWLNAERDSVHTVRDLRADVQDFVSRDGTVEGALDALRLEAVAPSDAGLLRVAAAGRFSSDEVALTQLDVRSRAGTDVGGAARLVFQDGALPVFEADIEAAPLALEDARAFAGVELYGDPRIRLRADSDGGALTFALNAALGEGALTLDGELSREPDGPVGYRAEGTLRRFDPSVLTRNEALAADITGDLRLDLRGEGLETLTGPFDVSLRESRVAGRQVDRLVVDGAFEAGSVTFDVNGALPGLDLVAEGRARPFEDIPSFRVAGRADDVDLGRLLPGAGRSDAFAGEFAVIGRGTSLDTFSGSVALGLSRAEIDLGDRRLRLRAFDLDADVADGRAAFDAAAVLPDGGLVAAVGTADLGADPLAYTVTDGRLQDVNLAVLTGDPSQTSDVTGSFTLDGRGLDPQTARIDLAASLRPSSYGDYRLESGRLALGLRRGVATVDLAADLGAGGAVTAAGTVRPFATPLAYDLSGTVRNLDLAAFTGNPDQASDLTGTFTATGAGIDPATLDATARVQITEPSSYGARLLDDADLTLRLARGDLALDGTIGTPEGRFDVAVTGRPFDGDPSFAFEETCFSGLDLSRFAAAAPRSDLNGCLSGSVSGLADLEAARGDGVVTLRPSTINGAEVEDGRVVFDLVDGAVAATLTLDLAEGGAVVAALQGRPFDETPTFSLRGRTDALDAAVLLDLPPDQPLRLTTTFDVDLRGTDPETLSLTASLAGGSSVAGPVSVDTLRAELALDRGVLRVDTLLLDSDVADLTGGGTLALLDAGAASDFRLAGEIESLTPIASYTGGTLGLESGSFALAARAAPGDPLAITGTVEAQQLVVGEYAATGIDADLDLTWDRAAADSLGLAALAGGADASFSVLSTPQFLVQEGEATVALDDGEVTLDGSVLLDERRDLDFFARLEAGATPPTVLLERGQFTIDGQTWALLQPARITAADGVVDVRGLLLAADGGGQQIAADGEIDFNGDQNFIVTAEDVEIGGVTDLLGYDGLGGRLTATLVLSGPAAAPLIDGTVALDSLTSRDDLVGSLAATVAYADRQLDLDAVLTHVDGQALTVAGTLPLAFSLAPGDSAAAPPAAAGVDLRAQADAFPIAWAQPFLADRGITALGGDLRLDLAVSGTQGAPRLDGTALLRGGRLGIEATGQVFEPVRADLRFENDRIVLNDVRVLDGARQALSVEGSVRLRELSVGELDLTIVPDDFVALDTPTFRRLTLDRGSEPIRLTGTIDRPVLRGAVALESGDIYLTNELTANDVDAVELTDAQLLELEATFGRTITARDTAVNRFVDALDYDITAEIRQNVWLRSNAPDLQFDIEFEGNVEAVKPSFAESSRLFGQIDLVRGTVNPFPFSGRDFEIVNGTLTFNGDPLAVVLDVRAESDVRLQGSAQGSAATIVFTLQGPFNENPEITLSSDPPLPQADLISLIATGQLSGEVGAGGVGAGFLRNQLQSVGGGLVPLDLFQIDVNAQNQVVIRLGKYLSDRLFMSGSFPVNNGDNARLDAFTDSYQATLEYQLRRWLALQGAYGDQTGVEAGAQAKISW